MTNVWAEPNSWQVPEPRYLERRGLPIPEWPCADCTSAGPEPVCGRYCFAAVGPGLEHAVGCKRTGKIWDLRYPRQASLFEPPVPEPAAVQQPGLFPTMEGAGE